MASGQLGSANVSATTNTAVYTVPSGKTSAFTINLCNTSSVSVSVRVALAKTETPEAGEYIEYDVTIPAGGVLERGGVVLDATKNVVVYASASGINANVWGYEE